jgi:plastocyanin
VLEHNDVPNFEQAVLPHLDAAYNLARWLMRNEQAAEDDESSDASAKRGRRNDSGVMRLAFRPSVVSKLRLNSLVLALLVPIAMQATGETNGSVGVSAHEVAAHVRFLDVNSGETLKDGSQVVVWLVPMYTVQKVRLNTELPHYRITQRNKIFEPHLLVVPAGSTVEFPNHDPWLHNVFSVSSNRRFDLGLYGAGVRKAVKFDRAGASHLFCSIHPEMAAVILTVDSTYFGVSDDTGRISIGSVPSGKYSLQVWYEDATPQALEALRRDIFVGDESRSLPTISIALPNGIPMTGKNGNSDRATLVGANWRRR